MEEQRPPILIASPCKRCGALIFWDYSDPTKKGKPRPKEIGTRLHHTPAQCRVSQWWTRKTVGEVIDPMDITSQGYDEWNF